MGPPAAGCKPAIFCFAAETAGSEEREQAIEVEERVPLDLRVSRAEDGSDLCWGLRGARAALRVVASIGREEAATLRRREEFDALA